MSSTTVGRGGWGVAAALAAVLAPGLAPGLGCDPSFRQVGPGVGGPGSTSDTGAGAWVCDLRNADGRCLTYVGLGWDAGSRSGDCSPGSVQGACPSAGRLGTCTFLPGDPLEKDVTYYSGPYYSVDDTTFLQADCEINFGTWTP